MVIPVPSSLFPASGGWADLCHLWAVFSYLRDLRFLFWAGGGSAPLCLCGSASPFLRAFVVGHSWSNPTPSPVDGRMSC